MDECIFCKIANGEAPAEVVYQDELVMAFKDIYPSAPIHLLIVPKVHIKSLVEVNNDNEQLLGRLLLVAQKLAEDSGIAENGYKTVINTGRDGGQIVDHLHVHLLGGEKIGKLV